MEILSSEIHIHYAAICWCTFRQKLSWVIHFFSSALFGLVGLKIASMMALNRIELLWRIQNDEASEKQSLGPIGRYSFHCQWHVVLYLEQEQWRSVMAKRISSQRRRLFLHLQWRQRQWQGEKLKTCEIGRIFAHIFGGSKPNEIRNLISNNCQKVSKIQ